MLSWFDTELNSLAWFDHQQISVSWFDDEISSVVVPPAGPSTQFGGIGIDLSTPGGVTLYDEGYGGVTPVSLPVTLSMSAGMNLVTHTPGRSDITFNVGLGLGGTTPIAYGAGAYGAANYGGSIGPSMTRRVTSKRPLAATVTMVPAFSNQVLNSIVFNVPFSISLGTLPLMQRKITKAIAASLVLAASSAPQSKVFRAIAASLAVTAAVSRAVKNFRAMAASLVLTGAFTKTRRSFRTQASQLLLTPVSQFNTSNLKSQSMVVDMPLNPVMSDVEKNYIPLSADFILSPDIRRKITLPAQAVGMPLISNLTPSQTRYLTVAGSLVLTGAQSRQLFRSLSFPASLTLNGALAAKQISYKRLDALVILAPTAPQKTFTTFSTSLVLLPTMIRNPILARPTISASLNLTATEYALRLKQFATGMPMIPASVQKTSTTFAVSLVLISIAGKRTPQHLDSLLQLQSALFIQSTGHLALEFNASLILDADFEIDLNRYRRILTKNALLGARIPEAHLLSAELKGN